MPLYLYEADKTVLHLRDFIIQFNVSQSRTLSLKYSTSLFVPDNSNFDTIGTSYLAEILSALAPNMSPQLRLPLADTPFNFSLLRSKILKHVLVHCQNLLYT